MRPGHEGPCIQSKGAFTIWGHGVPRVSDLSLIKVIPGENVGNTDMVQKGVRETSRESREAVEGDVTRS